MVSEGNVRPSGRHREGEGPDGSAKKSSGKKDSGKKEAETEGHGAKKGGVHQKTSAKKGDQPDVSGHIVARSTKKRVTRRGDDLSVHVK